MRVQFRETMRGELTDAAGGKGQVEFHVVARGEGRGFFTLEGVGSAPPWAAQECPASGTLIISPLLRFLRYEVRLGAPGGKAWVVHGEKRPSLLAPLHSMTEMPTRLEDEGGKVVAQGAMRFALTDLPDFLRSWLPLPSAAADRLLETRQALLSQSGAKR